MHLKIPKNTSVVLFDGVCNLCSEAIQWIIRRDKKEQFVFASLQSDIGKSIAKEAGIDLHNTDSIILYSPEKGGRIKSNAALEIANLLGGRWRLLLVGYLLPRYFRDLIYDWVAKNRYRWFGKKAQCMIPDKNLKNKFL